MARASSAKRPIRTRRTPSGSRRGASSRPPGTACPGLSSPSDRGRTIPLVDVREIKPVWKTSSFLVYTGGLTGLFGGLFALGYLDVEFKGGGARTAWALLILVVLWLIAETLHDEDEQ